MATNPKGCTSVDEWLAKGGVPKRDRDIDANVIYLEHAGASYEFVSDSSTSAPYRCRVSGIYGWQRPHVGAAGVRPHVCRDPDCSLGGTHQRGGRFWCEQHSVVS